MKTETGTVTIEDFVSFEPVTVSPLTKIEEVMALFRKHRFRHLPVVEKGKPVGIISDRDILLSRPMGVSALMCAKDVMSLHPYAVTADAPLEETALELSKRKFGSALVVNQEGQLCGIFTTTDALNALVEHLRSAL